MKMDRNANDDGTGKYAILNMRRLRLCETSETFQRWSAPVETAIKTLEDVGAIQWGGVGEDDEFFVVKLKDKHALAALIAYADSMESDDPEFAAEVREMTQRAGPNSPYCKAPD